MGHPKLTVITSVYNGEEHIKDCIENVIAQKCSSVEHLILDDASTDRTAQIIEGYAQKYPHIRFVGVNRLGQSRTMNKAIELAQGAIISFLNDDDFYEPDILDRVIKLFDDLPEPSMLVGNCNVWDQAGKLYYFNRPTHLSITSLLAGPKVYHYPVNPSAYFYHKSLHKVIGPYNENEDLQMDLDFLLRAVKVAHVVHVDKTWGNFRYIPGTKTFDESASGELNSERNRMFDEHLRKLPLVHQSWIHFLRFTIPKYRYFLSRIRHYVKNPADIKRFINNRFLR